MATFQTNRGYGFIVCYRRPGRTITADGTPAKRHLCTAAVEAAHPGDVIVVEHHARDDCAGWGGILSTAAKAKSATKKTTAKKTTKEE